MFAAVMLDPANCKPLLEMILGIDIGKVEVSHEKSIVYNPEYHGVRLDVYAKDEAGSHYNIEMQVRSTEVVKRSRYYHSQMDMELLGTGTEYEKLQEAVKQIKKSREMGSRYMIFQEMIQEEFEAGKAEGLKQGLERGRIEKIESILELLRKHGTVDRELEESIGKYTDFDMLRKLFTLAVNVDSVEEFVLQMKDI